MTKLKYLLNIILLLSFVLTTIYSKILFFRGESVFLASAYFSLGSSMFIDILQERTNLSDFIPHVYSSMFEEWFKFVGIVIWAYFWWRISKRIAS